MLLFFFFPRLKAVSSRASDRSLQLAVKLLPGQDITGSLITEQCHLPLCKNPKTEDGCNDHQEKQHRNAGNEDVGKTLNRFWGKNDIPDFIHFQLHFTHTELHRKIKLTQGSTITPQWISSLVHNLAFSTPLQSQQLQQTDHLVTQVKIK